MISARVNLKNWLNAFNEKDIDKMMSYYDAESLYASAVSPMITGIDEIKLCYSEAFKKIKSKLLFKEEKFVEGRDLSLIVGKYFFQPLNKEKIDEGSAGRVALVYKKSIDDKWLLLFDMDNRPPDCSSQDFIED